MVKYIICFRGAKITLGDLLDVIDKDGDMFYVPKFLRDVNKWALLVHESKCEQVETVLRNNCVRFTKEVCE